MTSSNSSKKIWIAVGAIAFLAVAGVLYFKNSKGNQESAPISNTSDGLPPEEGETADELGGGGEEGSESSEGAAPKSAALVSVKVHNDEKGEAIEKLVQASSILDQAQMIDELLDAQFDQMMGGMEIDADEQAQIDKIREMVSGERILAQLKEELYQTMSTEEINDLVKIHNDPVMEQVKEREAYLRSPEGQKELMKMTPPNLTPDRKAALEKFDEASGSTRRAKEIMMGTAKLFPSEEGGFDIAKQLESPEFTKMFKEQTLQSNAIKFQNLSNEDLSKASTLYANPAKQKEENALMKVVLNTQGDMGKIVAEQEKKHRESNPPSKDKN